VLCNLIGAIMSGLLSCGAIFRGDATGVGNDTATGTLVSAVGTILGVDVGHVCNFADPPTPPLPPVVPTCEESCAERFHWIWDRPHYLMCLEGC
jgi:hypothetical protein